MNTPRTWAGKPRSLGEGEGRMEGCGGWTKSRTKPGRARVYSLGHGLSYSAINVDEPAPGALTCRYYMPHGRSPACARPSPPRSGRRSAPLGLCSSVAAGNGREIVTSGEDGGAIAKRCTEARPSTSSLSVRLPSWGNVGIDFARERGPIPPLRWEVVGSLTSDHKSCTSGRPRARISELSHIGERARVSSVRRCRYRSQFGSRFDCA